MPHGRASFAEARLSSSGGEMPDTPSLDLVPQELTAIIDAWFIADVAEL